MKHTHVTVYQDTDKLGRGEFFSYVSLDGHILENFGGFKTADEARAVAENWEPQPVKSKPLCNCYYWTLTIHQCKALAGQPVEVR